MSERKRRANKRKFENWEDLPNKERRYWYDVPGRLGWFARYIKVVNKNEETVRFYQQIFDNNHELVEVHEKYPKDRGHQKIKEK